MLSHKVLKMPENRNKYTFERFVEKMKGEQKHKKCIPKKRKKNSLERKMH